jgi:xylulose-5-phosphate/fructose-6-phosphate phosphoketolase
LQYLNIDDAITHCTKGIGIWQWASNDAGAEPDVVMASCGDVVTQEALAATALLREHIPDIKIRFVNVVDLFKLIQAKDHPHGLSEAEFRSIFTDDKPVIFNFHSYPWLVYRLTYGRKGSHNLHVSGYREKGNIDTPVELAIRNGVDRFSLAIAAIDRMPELGNRAASVRENLLDAQIKAKNTSYFEGVDPKNITEWKWPF